jgi:hypothetical protein
MYKISTFILAAINFMLIGCGISIQPKGDVIQNKTNPVLALCEASNLLKMGKKSMIRFTFNVQLPDKTVSRSWRWNIKRNIVYLDGKQVNTDDKRFVNDKYWLLFPLMAHYDREQTRVSMNPKSQSPISNETCIEITVKYFDGEGYTPNDIYKLYCKDDMRIFEWAYYKGGQNPPARVTKWNDYNEFNGIFLSMTRPSEGRFKVWFTDVSIN